MRALIVGDVHAKVEDLEDCERLRAFVLGKVEEHDVRLVIFLGDQYDNHAIKHVDVERFWMGFFHDLRVRGARVVALVGNHDRPGNASSKSHSMQVHRDDVLVVDEPTVEDDILFLPYYHDPRALLLAAQSHPGVGVAICHAAFQGGHYDNGQPIKADAFYGKDVANPDDFPQHFIISGHIHKPANFGKVWYPGSPRWQTMSDANTSRAIWLVGFGNEAGFEKSFSTDEVLRRTWQLDYSYDDRCEAELALVRSGDKVLLNIRGTGAFCETAKQEFQSRGYRVRVFPTDRGVAKVSESEGIDVAWRKHLASYRPKFGTSPNVLRDMLRERLNV
jgi:DNA repair exonuclease SbcCD nuclease subunit